MTHSSQTSTSDEYIPQSDSAEAKRLEQLYASQGLGSTLYAEADEEMVGFLGEMGFGAPDLENLK